MLCCDYACACLHGCACRCVCEIVCLRGSCVCECVCEDAVVPEVYSSHFEYEGKPMSFAPCRMANGFGSACDWFGETHACRESPMKITNVDETGTI